MKRTDLSAPGVSQESLQKVPLLEEKQMTERFGFWKCLCVAIESHRPALLVEVLSRPDVVCRDMLWAPLPRALWSTRHISFMSASRSCTSSTRKTISRLFIAGNADSNRLMRSSSNHLSVSNALSYRIQWSLIGTPLRSSTPNRCCTTWANWTTRNSSFLNSSRVIQFIKSLNVRSLNTTYKPLFCCELEIHHL